VASVMGRRRGGRAARGALVTALALAAAAPAAAQFRGVSGGPLLVAPPPAVGVRGSYDFDTEAFAVGVQFRYPLAPMAEIALTGDYAFGDTTSGWQVDLDLTSGMMLPGVYLGVGAALAHRAFLLFDIPTQPKQTKVGFTVLLGGTLPPMVRSPVIPYVEMRWTLFSGYDSQAALAVGMNVLLGEPPPRPHRRRR
jgi:hypothetical protein